MPRFTRLVTEMDGDGMANMKWNQTWRARMKTTPNLKFTLVKLINVGPLNDAMQCNGIRFSLSFITTMSV